MLFSEERTLAYEKRILLMLWTCFSDDALRIAFKD